MPDDRPIGAMAESGGAARGDVARRAALAESFQPSATRLALAVCGAPAAWTAHLLLVYLVVPVWCSTRWAGAGLAIAALTVLCALAAAGSGGLALGIYRRAQEGLRHDPEPGGPEPWDARMGERGARAVFLAVVAMFLAAIFSLAIVLEGLPPLFAPLCPAWTMP